MIELITTGFQRVKAVKQDHIINMWLREVRGKAQEAFARGMLGPHSGKVYMRRRGPHVASSNATRAEYPANDTGTLLASLKSRQTPNSATIGTNVYYARFLRGGTVKMARRKMTDDALLEGAKAAKHKSKGWIAFERAKQP